MDGSNQRLRATSLRLGREPQIPIQPLWTYLIRSSHQASVQSLYSSGLSQAARVVLDDHTGRIVRLLRPSARGASGHGSDEAHGQNSCGYFAQCRSLR
jgi:hypothetical protein